MLLSLQLMPVRSPRQQVLLQKPMRATHFLLSIFISFFFFFIHFLSLQSLCILSLVGESFAM